MTIFEKIVSREIPAQLIHEDDDLFAFHDINPQAPIHVLIVPKKAIARIGECAESDQPLLGKLLYTAQSLAHSLGIAESGFRIVINNGPNGGESVPHLHVHLMGGRTLGWPPG